MKLEKTLKLLKQVLEVANELQEKQNEALRLKKDAPKYFERSSEKEIAVGKDPKKTEEDPIYILKTTPLNVNPETAKGIIYYQSNGTCVVYIDEMYCKSITIHIEGNFVVEKTYLSKKRLPKVSETSSITDYQYLQFGNNLIVS